MNKRLNNSGFSVVETSLVIIIVFLLGAAGWLVYDRNHKPAQVVVATSNKTTSTTTTPKTTSSDPYTGWTSASLKYEQLSYKYPSNWTLKDYSTSSPKSAGNCVYPGVDDAILISPSGSEVNLYAGFDCKGNAQVTSFGSVPISTMGQNDYLVYMGDNVGSDPTMPSYACLSPTSSAASNVTYSSKNIFETSGTGTPNNFFCYSPYGTNSMHNQPISGIENSTDYSTAKLIFESMHY
jgi:hypothetical protein